MSASSLPPGAIDCHAHVMRKDAPLASERHSAPRRDVTVDEYVAVLDAHGVARGVLTAPSFYGTDNTILTQALAAQPARLRGTAIVAPDIDDRALDALGASGVVGIRLNLIRRATLPDLAGAPYQALFANLRARDWQVEIFLEGPKLAIELPKIRASGARVVVDHFGAPDPARGTRCAGFTEVLAGVRNRDTWVKLSAPYRLGGADPQRYVDALLEAGGPEQLVWASDWPFVSHEDEIRYAQCVAWINDWIPDEATRRVVLVDTPARLFHFDRVPAQTLR